MIVGLVLSSVAVYAGGQNETVEPPEVSPGVKDLIRGWNRCVAGKSAVSDHFVDLFPSCR